MENKAKCRLNPDAVPYFPSTFHLHRCFNQSQQPLQQPTTPKCRNFVSYSGASLPNGPTNRNNRRKTPNFGRKLFHNGCGYKQDLPLKKFDNSTTVMIKNIPNNYTRNLLVEFLEDHCKNENEKDKKGSVRSAFDFVYLPVDFETGMNKGYAFVNFTTSEAAWKFHTCVRGKTWKLFLSKKTADVTRAKIQGKEALVRNFVRMNLYSPSLDYLPVWFEPPRDGCLTSASTMKMHTIGSVA